MYWGTTRDSFPKGEILILRVSTVWFLDQNPPCKKWTDNTNEMSCWTRTSNTMMILLQVQIEHHQLVHEKQQQFQQLIHKLQDHACLCHFWNTLAICMLSGTFLTHPDPELLQCKHQYVSKGLPCPQPETMIRQICYQQSVIKSMKKMRPHHLHISVQDAVFSNIASTCNERKRRKDYLWIPFCNVYEGVLRKLKEAFSYWIVHILIFDVGEYGLDPMLNVIDPAHAYLDWFDRSQELSNHWIMWLIRPLHIWIDLINHTTLQSTLVGQSWKKGRVKFWMGKMGPK